MQVAPGQPPPSAGCDYWFDQTYNTQFHTFEDIVDKEVATGELGYSVRLTMEPFWHDDNFVLMFVYIPLYETLALRAYQG